MIYMAVRCRRTAIFRVTGEPLNRSMTSGCAATSINAAMGVLLLMTAISVLIS